MNRVPDYFEPEVVFRELEPYVASIPKEGVTVRSALTQLYGATVKVFCAHIALKAKARDDALAAEIAALRAELAERKLQATRNSEHVARLETRVAKLERR